VTVYRTTDADYIFTRHSKRPFLLQILQVIFQVLSVLVPAYVTHKPDSGPSSGARDKSTGKATGRSDARDEKKKAQPGDNEASKLIKHSTQIFKAMDEQLGTGSKE
jgi:hypothetical protein